MKQNSRQLINLYIMQALAKGFTVFYFVLLPIFFAQNLISSKQLGYVGAFFIVMLIAGAVIVARWLHNLETKTLLQLSSLVAIGASTILFIASWQQSFAMLLFSYGLMGLATGTAMSGVNAVAAHITTKGDRYKSLAKLGMMMDIVRIIFPLIAAGAVAIGATSAAITLIIGAALFLLAFSSSLPHFHSPEEQLENEIESIRSNKNFLYILFLEFLDSFSSSQLFVFLPLIFLAKGYSLESSLLLQSFIFMGYLSGRWLVSFLAKRYSGIKAIAYAEIGMVICIFLLLITNNIWLLYILSFALGVFARGTSPAIKALAFDSLTDGQMRKGSALHVIAGDSGSALGQFIFGFLVAWYGASSPFIVAAAVAIFIAISCLVIPTRLARN